MRTFRIILASVLAAAGISVMVTPPASAASAGVGKFAQCANGTGTAVTCTGWINGAIQSSNSHYREDDVVPQRVEITLPADNATHTLVFNYQDRKGSVHAYDSLATWNKTVTNASPCDGVTNGATCSGTPSTWQMTADPAPSIPPTGAGISPRPDQHDLADADRQWTMYGGVLTGDAVVGHSSPASGDDLVTVSVSFRNPTPAAESRAVLLFGGHLAVGGPDTAPRAWGQNLGASSVSGGPYSFKLESIDGGSAGAQANSIQAGATAPLPPAAFTITKTANPATANAGQQVTYTVTVKNTGGTAGSTTFTDDYDNNLTGVSTPAGCTQGSGSMSCTTGSIAAGGSQVFTYTANMPATFTSGANTGGCTGGRYPVTNTATLANTTTAAATVCVSAAAAFTVTKAANVTNPAPGQTVTYTITVKNTGNASGSTTFTDDYDNQLSPSPATSNPAGNNCSPSGGTFSCTTGTLAPNGTQTFTYTAAMPASFSTGTACSGGFLVKNTVTLAGGTSDSANVCVQTTPGFVVQKSANDTTVAPGETVTYTVKVTNNGTGPGSTTVVDDYDNRLDPSTPTGCTKADGKLTCTTGSLAPNASQSFVYTAVMPTSFSGSNGACATGSFPVANTATAGNSSSSVTVCVAAAPTFSIAKTVDDTTGTPGQTVHYTIKVTNTGTATGSTSFTDDYDNRLNPSLPTSADGSCTADSGQFHCTAGPLASGQTATFTYAAQLPQTYGATSGGNGCVNTYPVVNTASLDSSAGSSTATVCVTAAPNFTVEKTASDTAPKPGDTVTYTIKVSNTGSAAGSTTFEDDYDNALDPTSPTGCTDDGDVLTCTTGVIAAHDSVSINYTAKIPDTFSGPSGGGSCAPGSYPLSNGVTVGTATDDVTVCVPAAPKFTITKTVDKTVAAPGDTVEYTITVKNTGTADGSTTFTDDYDQNRVTPTVPAGCTDNGDTLTCRTGTIPAGGSQPFVYTGALDASFSGDTGTGCADGQFAVHNTATLANDSAASQTVCVDADARFTVTKTVSDETAAPGQTVHYTITVTNNGDAAGSTGFTDDYNDRTPPSGAVTGSKGGTCTDAAGALACTTGTLNGGGDTETFEYDATVPSTFGTNDGTQGCPVGSYAIKNTVTLTDGPSSSATTCVAAAPDFSVAKSADDDHAEPGQRITYTVTVTNNGKAAGSTDVTDDFDDRLTDVSDAVSDPAGNNCSPVAGSFQCTTGVIPAGGSQSFTYSANLPTAYSGEDGVAPCGDGEYGVLNTVTLEEGGASIGNTVCVAAAPTFVITKSVDDATPAPGQTVTYTIRVENTGTAAGSTTFVDNYDDRFEDSITVPAGCVKLLGTLGCETGTIAAGGHQLFQYSATVPTTFTGEQGGGSCAADEYRIGNEVLQSDVKVAGQDLCISAGPRFEVEKSVDNERPAPGDTVEYTVTVTNSGNGAGATTIVDDYDNRLHPTVPDGCVQDTDEGTLTCTTGTLLSGESQDFVYRAEIPATFSGESGTEPCAPGEYRIANAVSLGDEQVADKTLCVAAAPKFRITKSADDTTADPGQTITYTIVVSNTGEVAGSKSFTDNYDDRLTPTVPEGCTAGDGVLTCTTGVIEPGASQTFTYTATMPATYTGPSGANGCPTGSYGVSNTVALDGGGDTASAPVCVAAKPEVSITKAASLAVANDGAQTITYTIDYKNTGAAEALGVVVTDQVPAGTGFVSCSNDCTLSGSPATATWAIGSLAPKTGSGSVTLVVKVTGKTTCAVSNTAKIKVGSDPAISSNTTSTPVTPQPDPSTAKSNGEATGASIRTNGLLNILGPLTGYLFTNNNTLKISNADSSKTGPGAPAIDSDSVLTAKVPGDGTLLSAGVLTTATNSTVNATPAETRQTSVAEVAGLCVVRVAGICTVSADVVRAVATTSATGSYATNSTAGSTITNLKVVNTAVPVDLNTTVTIPLNAAVFGPNSYVAINERTGSAGLQGGKYVADQSVAMIHVKITGVLLGLQAAEIYVARATAHSQFDKTFVCTGQNNQQVSGHAFLAKLFTGPILADLIVGYSQIAPLGGDQSSHVVEMKIPPAGGVIAWAKAGDTRSRGGFTTGASEANSWAEVAGDGTQTACVLLSGGCIVQATLVRSEATSKATASGSTSTDAGTRLVDLKVLGIPIAGTPKPNTTITLPGIGFIILNEQICDNGGNAVNGTCSGAGHSGLTVRALRVVITVANPLLKLDPGVELVVSEAHADSSFS